MQGFVKENLICSLLQVTGLIWSQDLRVQEVRRLLQSSRPVRVSVVQLPEVSDHEYIEEKENKWVYCYVCADCLLSWTQMLTHSNTANKRTRTTVCFSVLWCLSSHSFLWDFFSVFCTVSHQSVFLKTNHWDVWYNQGWPTPPVDYIDFSDSESVMYP